MRFAYDRAAKEILVAAFGGRSLELTPEREIAPDAQFLDLWCEPDPSRIEELAQLGILQRIAADGPCAFEFFHEAPALDELLGSLRKVLAIRRPAMLPARPGEPWLWIVAGGRPGQAMAALGFEPEPDWPPGFYRAASGFRQRLIVTSELPVRADTLLLRALGSGRTLRSVRRELRELGAAHPISRIVDPILLKLHIEQRERPMDTLDPVDQEFQMETQDLYEEWHRKVLAEGRQEGRREGHLEGRLEGHLEGRLEGEAQALLRVLAARGVTISPSHEEHIRACREVTQLELWLERALTATNIDDVLR